MKKSSVRAKNALSGQFTKKKAKADAFEGLDFEKLVKLTVTRTSVPKKKKNEKK